MKRKIKELNEHKKALVASNKNINKNQTVLVSSVARASALAAPSRICLILSTLSCCTAKCSCNGERKKGKGKGKERKKERKNE